MPTLPRCSARTPRAAVTARQLREALGLPPPARAIDPAEHLYDAGYVDSQSSVALLAFIEEEWGLVISEVDLVGRLSSLDALARHLRNDGQVGEANRA